VDRLDARRQPPISLALRERAGVRGVLVPLSLRERPCCAQCPRVRASPVFLGLLVWRRHFLLGRPIHAAVSEAAFEHLKVVGELALDPFQVSQSRAVSELVEHPCGNQVRQASPVRWRERPRFARCPGVLAIQVPLAGHRPKVGRERAVVRAALAPLALRERARVRAFVIFADAIHCLGSDDHEVALS
jgi:hypothetical protein